jgi:hypothetical protein
VVGLNFLPAWNKIEKNDIFSCAADFPSIRSTPNLPILSCSRLSSTWICFPNIPVGSAGGR